MYHRYRITIYTFAALTLCYAVIGALSPAHLIKEQEIFPFFSWSLFSSPKRTATEYQVVALPEGLEVETGAWPEGRLPQGKGLLWLPLEAEGKTPGLAKLLGFFGRELLGGQDLLDAVAKWRPHLERFVPEGYRGYYLVRLELDPIAFYLSDGRERAGQTLGYFEVAR